MRLICMHSGVHLTHTQQQQPEKDMTSARTVLRTGMSNITATTTAIVVAVILSLCVG